MLHTDFVSNFCIVFERRFAIAKPLAKKPLPSALRTLGKRKSVRANFSRQSIWHWVHVMLPGQRQQHRRARGTGNRGGALPPSGPKPAAIRSRESCRRGDGFLQVQPNACGGGQSPPSACPQPSWQ